MKEWTQVLTQMMTLHPRGNRTSLFNKMIVKSELTLKLSKSSEMTTEINNTMYNLGVHPPRIALSKNQSLKILSKMKKKIQKKKKKYKKKHKKRKKLKTNQKKVIKFKKITNYI